MQSTITPVFANIDLVELLLILFIGFFIGLVLYLMRENRREGYPLEEDTTGRQERIEGFLWWPAPKSFVLPNGAGVVSKPDPADRDARPVAARRMAVWPGAPLVPAGDPLVDGVGPAAFAERAKTPDIDIHGAPRIVPMRAAPGFSIAKEDPDPRGMTILGADGRAAGVVKEVWIDRMESLIRYLEVEIASEADAPARIVLAPFAMCSLNAEKRLVKTDSIAAAQFRNAPAIAATDRITRNEEDRLIGYFGGGYLYSSPTRAEPLV
jgi:photosynthetic reaction center H subunit